MTLLDHFRPPLSERRQWFSFFSSWAVYLAADLNRRLPVEYIAEPDANRANKTASVRVLTDGTNHMLVGAIELISPTNKDRPASRDAFVSKCAAYLQAGVGLVVVDVVTERSANLHHDLLSRLGIAATVAEGSFAAAYRTVERDGVPSLDAWHEPLAVGRVLPTLPLWLRGDLCLPVELQAAYDRACADLRLPAA